MKEKQNDNVNYDVLNTLYLVDDKLGKKFEDNGKNPLGENFVLGKGLASDLLKNSREAKKEEGIELPDYISEGNAKVSSNFKKIQSQIKEIDEMLSASTDLEPELVEQMSLFLKILKEMLAVAIDELSSDTADSVKIYSRVSSSNPKLFKLLQNAYKKEFDKMVALQNIFALAHKNYQLNSNVKDESLANKTVQKSTRQSNRQEEQKIEKSELTPEKQTVLQEKTQDALSHSKEPQPEQNTAKVVPNLNNLTIAGVSPEELTPPQTEKQPATKATPLPRFRNDDLER